ncbi:epi-neemfruitin B synthase L1AT-like [Coffea arabica]|uniref:Epi-neemfruitin B synthase L1AT-like n=1 Tax=Coffea arabica TaxID=13443 RepID=A0ABM4U8K4_COFAR
MCDTTKFNRKPLQHVEVLTKKLVKPSSPTPNRLQNYKLSSFDQLAPRSLVHLVYFYENNDSCKGNHDEAGVVQRHEILQISLAETLSHFRPLAGRISDDGRRSVDCQDQGALYIEAKVNCQLNQFLNQAYEDVELLADFIPDGGLNGDGALLKVQVTFFLCGGFALTCSISHTVADGFTGCTFFDEWAKMCGHGKDNNNICDIKCLSFNLASTFPSRDLPAVPRPVLRPSAKVVSKLLLFDEFAIKSLKNKVIEATKSSTTITALHDDIDASVEFRPSRLEVVTAFIWRGLIRAAQKRHGYLRASMTTISVNLRGKTALGIEDNSFGNLFVAVPIKFIPDETKMELHHFVQLIRTTLQEARNVYTKASSADEIFLMVQKFQDQVQKELGDKEVDTRLSTSLRRFPLYGADFGWGKPSWIILGNVGGRPEMFCLLDTKCGTGVEVRVNLNEVEMPIFESDPEIVSVTSVAAR